MTLNTQLSGLALLAALSIGRISPALAQDAAAGEKVFKTQCSVCHQVIPEKKGIGPNLFGVVGRKSGTVPGFHYTEANKNSGLTWDAATLDRYLQAPRDVVPGTAMPYAGLKDPTQRTDLIAYLATLK
jgi:cytochrome c